MDPSAFWRYSMVTCFAIRSQPPEQSALPHICELLPELCGHGVGQRHAILCLIRGVPKHNPLVASPDIQVLFADVDTTGDVGALLVDAYQDLTCLVAQPFAIYTGHVVHIRIK